MSYTESMLLEFQALPRVLRTSTFMEIAGYSHYENVCSNILGFYFDPTAEHGFGDLLLRAFIRTANEPDLLITGEVSVTREFLAEERKRIDLLIECDTLVLAIENKLFHWEANDFDLYGRSIDLMADGRKVVKAVLCLNARASHPPPGGGFFRITYHDLWNHVRELLKDRLADAAPKWAIFLNEFMETTSRLAGETPEEREVIDFFIKHYDQIEKLVADHQRLLGSLHGRLRGILDGLTGLPETEKHLKSRGMCGSGILASHFEIEGKTIGMDLAVDLKGWVLMIWQKYPHDVIKQLLDSSSMRATFPLHTKSGGNYVLRRWDLHATRVELEEALVQGFKALIAAADFLVEDGAA